MPDIYFEDLTVGDTFEFEAVTFTKADIVEFGRQYDPLPFHVDEEAAKESIFGGLIASGIHLLAVSQRAVYEGFYSDAALLGGLGMDEVRFHAPCRPGDSLTTRLEVTALRESEKRPGRGILTTRRSMHDEDGEEVISMQNRAFVGRRDRAP